MQVTASHEWAESTVDPIPLIDYWGWTITEIQGEIADLCNTGTAAEHAEAAPGIFAAKLTDDYLWAANGTPCVVQDAAPIKFQVGTGGTNVQPRRAVLNGNVTPAGWPAYYQFAITGPEGTTYIPPRNGSPAAHYGFASVGQGFGNEPVSVTAPNLKPNTTYTVRLDALGALTEPKVISEYGHLKIFSGSEVQFTTPSWRPIVSGESVSGRAMEGATVNASINPQESPTHYAFEYGPTPAYGNRQPVPDENIGAGGSPVAVSQVLSGLSPEDSYHYHVVAANAEGTTTGSDRAFTTLGRPFTFLSAFGTAGTGNGQFNRPMGTAVDASGNVYVVDRENNRVQKFNAKGEYLSQFGSAGSGNGQFKEPRSIAIGPNGHLWVADAGNARIEEFSAAGAYLQQLSAGLAGPYGIAVDNEGRIWVSDPTNNSIVEFKEASENVYNYFGAFTAVEGLPLNAPGGLGLDPATNDVWVAETGANRITELEKTPSGFVAHIRFGSAGAGQGQISQPYDVKVKASGNLVVVDRGNNRVEQFSPSGEFQAAFGTKGAGAGQFNEPSGIAVAGGGVFYVTDSGNKRVERWSQPAKPEVATLAPAGVTDKSATLKGSVNPSGVATTYRFEYGPTTAYGTSVPIPNGSVGSGVETIAENQTLVTEPETTIHYRIVATNAEGTRFGSDVRFTTPAEPFTFLSAFGTAGTGNGQFNRPMGTAVDASGNVYVVDRENNRVQKFNAKGEYLSQFGSAGSGNGQFKEPRSIAIGPNGHLWVADAGNARIEEFSAAGAYLQQLGSGKLTSPYGIAVDNEGRIWISDPAKNSVVEFKESSPSVYSYFGEATTTDGAPLKEPGGLGLDPATNDVWVAETGANRITELEKTPSGFVAHIRFGSAGAGQGQISQPYDVKVKASGNLVVVDRGNNRVEQFSPSGEFQAAFGTKGAGAGQFNEPSGIAVAGGGVFYVTDSGNKRVERWSQPAKPEVATLAPAGVTDKSATLKGSVNPSGVATTYRFEYGPTTAYGTSVPIPNGSVGSGVETIAENQTLVTEPETTIHYRIVATNAEGTRFGSDVRFTTPAEPFTFLSAFGTAGTGNGQFNRPMGTAVDASGNVYVVDRENNRVQKFNAKGEYLSQFGSAGSGNGQFKEPRSIAIGPNGHLWVADAGNARIEEFSAAGAYLQQLGSGKLTSPYGIAVDNEGRIWISDPAKNSVVEFKESSPSVYSYFGEATTTDGAPLKEPGGLGLDPATNDVWVAETGANRITELEKTPSGFVAHIRFGSAGAGQGQISQPYDVKVKASGNLVVVDRGNNRVEQFSPSGEFQAAFGTKGAGAGQFNEPSGIAVAGGGVFYVTDSGNKRVERWSSE